MTATTEREARILQAVDALRDDLVSLTQALIACRTDSQSVSNAEFPSEARRCHDIIAQQLAASGMSVERWDEPPYYPVTVGRLPGDGTGPSLAINGH
ncbi:MAG: hypothetical protein C4346_03530, partial [Chloroflexota bacterium]